MSGKLVPKKMFPSDFFRFPLFRFPSIWEDFGEMEEGRFGQGGLSVYEDNAHFYIEAQMPGLTPNDIDITLDKGVVTIKGEKEEKEEDKEKRYQRKASSSFAYRVAIPSELDEDKAEATYQDGVMKLKFKKQKNKQAKKIKIRKKS